MTKTCSWGPASADAKAADVAIVVLDAEFKILGGYTVNVKNSAKSSDVLFDSQRSAKVMVLRFTNRSAISSMSMM